MLERLDELFLEAVLRLAYLSAGEAKVFRDLDFNFGLAIRKLLRVMSMTRCERTAEYTTGLPQRSTKI